MSTEYSQRHEYWCPYGDLPCTCASVKRDAAARLAEYRKLIAENNPVDYGREG